MLYVTVTVIAFRNYQLKLISSFQGSGAPFQEILLVYFAPLWFSVIRDERSVFLHRKADRENCLNKSISCPFSFMFLVSAYAETSKKVHSWESASFSQKRVLITWHANLLWARLFSRDREDAYVLGILYTWWNNRIEQSRDRSRERKTM